MSLSKLRELVMDGGALQIYRKEPLSHMQVNVSSEDDRSDNLPPTERNCRTLTIKSESPGITKGPALQKYSHFFAVLA